MSLNPFSVSGLETHRTFFTQLCGLLDSKLPDYFLLSLLISTACRILRPYARTNHFNGASRKW